MSPSTFSFGKIEIDYYLELSVFGGANFYIDSVD